ncbi:MAG: ABC transporter permease [Clostridiales bacterium]|nr:ABC transporter permease [Candidatus Apopatousia equi]
MKNLKSKINYSLEHKKYLKKEKNKKIFITTIQFGVLVAIFGIWELLTQIGVLDSFIMSSPSRVFITIVDLFKTGNLLYHIGVTLYEATIGFVLATFIGLVVAILLWWSENLRKIMEPYLVVLNSLPKIALGPIIIVWFGAGTKSIIVMAFLIMIIITIISFLNAFMGCDEDKILLLKSMGASKFQILFKLILPYSIPEFISILKINVGMTWVGTIMGEYLVSKAGLGYLIVYGGQVFKLDLVMSSTIILCVLAAIMYGIVAIIEKKFKR